MTKNQIPYKKLQAINEKLEIDKENLKNIIREKEEVIIQILGEQLEGNQ